MKTIANRTAGQENSFECFEECFSKELGRLINRAHESGRSVVKAALREIRALKNYLKRDLERAREIEQRVKSRREVLYCKRFLAGGHML